MAAAKLRLAALSLSLLGLSARLFTAEPAAAPISVSSNAMSLGDAGLHLSLPGKSPLILPKLNAEGPSWLPAKEALVYAGCTVLWRSSAQVLQITAPNGEKARLVLGEPFLFEAVSRTALSQAPRLQSGAPALLDADLRLVLDRLVSVAPTWAAASPAELAGVLSLYQGMVPAEPTVEPTAEPQVDVTPEPAEGSLVAARILSGGRLRKIVLDAGHGGEDPGAHGHHGLLEKNVCLDIILRTQAELARLAPDIKVVLTRHDDTFVSLRDRTEFANKEDADLFVSVHNNASPDPKSKGTQVFFYDQATSDRAATDLVSRENEDVNELEVLLTDLAKSMVRDQSIGLADKVQKDLGKTLGLKHRTLSYAPFFVLARTKMPAILIEVAFITHPEEEKLLGNAQWRQAVASSIARGLVAYRRQVETK